MQNEIQQLKKTILNLGKSVEDAVQLSITALAQRDRILAQTVIDQDETIDKAEVELEEDCLKVLALHQPVANDLRFVVSVLKINNDLERIGDLAVNIAERALRLAPHPSVNIPFDFVNMGNKVQDMLRNCLKAVVNMDTTLAQEVCRADDDIDDLHSRVYEIVSACIKKDMSNLNSYIQFIVISRALERIADHATNIAEDVVYMTEGLIVRHAPMAKV